MFTNVGIEQLRRALRSDGSNSRWDEGSQDEPRSLLLKLAKEVERLCEVFQSREGLATILSEPGSADDRQQLAKVLTQILLQLLLLADVCGVDLGKGALEHITEQRVHKQLVMVSGNTGSEQTQQQQLLCSSTQDCSVNSSDTQQRPPTAQQQQQPEPQLQGPCQVSPAGNSWSGGSSSSPASKHHPAATLSDSSPPSADGAPPSAAAAAAVDMGAVTTHATQLPAAKLPATTVSPALQDGNQQQQQRQAVTSSSDTSPAALEPPLTQQKQKQQCSYTSLFCAGDAVVTPADRSAAALLHSTFAADAIGQRDQASLSSAVLSSSASVVDRSVPVTDSAAGSLWLTSAASPEQQQQQQHHSGSSTNSSGIARKTSSISGTSSNFSSSSSSQFSPEVSPSLGANCSNIHASPMFDGVSYVPAAAAAVSSSLLLQGLSLHSHSALLQGPVSPAAQNSLIGQGSAFLGMSDVPFLGTGPSAYSMPAAAAATPAAAVGASPPSLFLDSGVGGWSTGLQLPGSYLASTSDSMAAAATAAAALVSPIKPANMSPALPAAFLTSSSSSGLMLGDSGIGQCGAQGLLCGMSLAAAAAIRASTADPLISSNGSTATRYLALDAPLYTPTNNPSLALPAHCEYMQGIPLFETDLGPTAAAAEPTGLAGCPRCGGFHTGKCPPKAKCLKCYRKAHLGDCWTRCIRCNLVHAPGKCKSMQAKPIQDAAGCSNQYVGLDLPTSNT